MDTRASAMAWSDTARPRRRDLLSKRMVDLEKHRLPLLGPNRVQFRKTMLDGFCG